MLKRRRRRRHRNIRIWRGVGVERPGHGARSVGGLPKTVIQILGRGPLEDHDGHAMNHRRQRQPPPQPQPIPSWPHSASRLSHPTIPPRLPMFPNIIVRNFPISKLDCARPMLDLPTSKVRHRALTHCLGVIRTDPPRPLPYMDPMAHAKTHVPIDGVKPTPKNDQSVSNALWN